MKGIDVSKHNGSIDWRKVNASGKVGFVILRAGYGKTASQKDAMFETYYAGAKAAGLPVGVYWYSYAMSEDEARKEADACLEVLKGKQFEYPIYYDVEEKKQFDLGKDKVSKIIRAFLERVEEQNYWVGLYGSYSSLTTYTAEDIRTRYAIWLAHWNVTKSPYKGDYGMWQYGIIKDIPGIKGDVDADECYVDYPTLIREAGDNGFEKPSVPTPIIVPTPVEIAKVIRKGDNGESVKALQTALADRGYLRKNEIDGDFGVITLGALLAFQFENGLDVDGVAGPNTCAALNI